LDGLPIGSAQGASVQAAVETELARLLAADGARPMARASSAMPSVSAGDIQLRRGTGPVELGRQIAGAVYGSLGYTHAIR
jgi:hypothetical protein